MDGIILADKPSGITSYDVIRILTRTFDGAKMGHAGTLDPRASGLLIIGVGKATKSLDSFLKLDKTYDAQILFGVRTHSGDLDGRVIEQGDVSTDAQRRLNRIVSDFVGVFELPVPLVSAVKKDGVRLYKHARQGNPQGIVPPRRKMSVLRCSLESVCRTNGHVIAKISFAVESGVYIRSLAEELGTRLGVPATIAALRRTSIGPFSVDEAVIPGAATANSIHSLPACLRRFSKDASVAVASQ